MSEIPSIKLNRVKVDIKKVIIIPPEIDPEHIKESIEKKGYLLHNPLGKENSVFFSLDAVQVIESDFLEVDSKLDELKQSIKQEQVNFFDNQKDKLKIEDNFVKLLSEFIVEANKNTEIDSNNAFLILQNMLGNLYEHEIDGVKFLDEIEIEKLAKATVSKVVKECEYNLNSALIEILIKIRKLTLLWFYDSIQLSLYNVWTDKEEISIIQNNEVVEIDGSESKIIPLIVNRRKTYVAYCEVNACLITFNLGKKMQEAILPFIFSLFMNQALMNFKLEYSKMILNALKRYQGEIIHQMRNLRVNYNDLSLEQLEIIKKYSLGAIDFLYRGIVNYRNDIQTSNRMMAMQYRKNYLQTLSRRLGGGVSQRVLDVSPMRSLDEFNKLGDEIEGFVNSYSGLYEDVGKGMNDLISAKKQSNPGLFQKARDFIVERFDSITSKILGDIFKGGGT